MAEVVTASLTINFDSGKGSSQFSVEVDDRETGPNGGKTSFNPGDSVGLLLFASPNVSNIRSFITSGSLSGGGGIISVEKEEVISFAKETEASARYPVDAIIGYEWYGPGPSSIAYANGKFTVPPETFAIGKVKYRSRAIPYTVSGVTYPAALALFTGMAA